MNRREREADGQTDRELVYMGMTPVVGLRPASSGRTMEQAARLCVCVIQFVVSRTKGPVGY